MSINRSQCKIWLQIEAAAECALAAWLYSRSGSSWYLFAGLFLLPDLSMLGYLAGPREGAWSYNLFHFYALSLTVVGWTCHWPIVFAIGLIWSAHISADRMLGYGLKSPASFGQTHLGLIGRNIQSD